MIKIKLTRKEYMELLQVYDYFKKVYNVRGPHQLLLHGHMLQLLDTIRKKLQPDIYKKRQDTFTLTLDPVAALAFYQLWQTVDTSMFALGTVVICKVVEEINQTLNRPAYEDS